MVKENNLAKVVAYIGLVLVSNVVIHNADPINISYTILGFIFIMLLCFEGQPIQKISIVMVLYPIIVALNFITYDISVRIFFLLFKKEFLFNIIAVMSNLLICLSWLVIYKKFGKNVRVSCNLIDNRTWLLIDIICLAPLVSIFSAIINTPYGKEYQIYLTAFACIVTSLGMIILIEYMLKSIKTHMENQNLKLEYSYYKELEDNQTEIRKLRHDMNNHLGVIQSFIESENISGAREYYLSLSEKFRVSNREFCINSIVNAVINSKYNLAMDNNIDCFFNIDIEKLIPIDDIDLCSIFANTLDNAIEASLKIYDITNRRIVLKARCDKGYFSFSISNNIGTSVSYHKGEYVSDKDNKKLHGYGIKNIRGIVKKYNGTIEINHTDNEFNVVIAIKTK